MVLSSKRWPMISSKGEGLISFFVLNGAWCARGIRNLWIIYFFIVLWLLNCGSVFSICVMISGLLQGTAHTCFLLSSKGLAAIREPTHCGLVLFLPSPELFGWRETHGSLMENSQLQNLYWRRRDIWLCFGLLCPSF